MSCTIETTVVSSIGTALTAVFICIASITFAAIVNAASSAIKTELAIVFDLICKEQGSPWPAKKIKIKNPQPPPLRASADPSGERPASAKQRTASLKNGSQK
jgi:hypothetical protein